MGLGMTKIAAVSRSKAESLRAYASETRRETKEMGRGTRVAMMKDCFATEQKCGKPGMKRNEKKKKRGFKSVCAEDGLFFSAPQLCEGGGERVLGCWMALALELKWRA
jgi:hypothetical protein